MTMDDQCSSHDGAVHSIIIAVSGGYMGLEERWNLFRRGRASPAQLAPRTEKTDRLGGKNHASDYVICHMHASGACLGSERNFNDPCALNPFWAISVMRVRTLIGREALAFLARNDVSPEKEYFGVPSFTGWITSVPMCREVTLFPGDDRSPKAFPQGLYFRIRLLQAAVSFIVLLLL
uniref:Uncharacterized protein n=1 Tax=Coccidioides posadasii RMSCC 3488 TaxID=454284 RepID=A0A0J6I9H5_COCPO|nr:hypothetical protein CPAG_04577 [Coccidioides posadasii RMSCC 3488]